MIKLSTIKLLLNKIKRLLILNYIKLTMKTDYQRLLEKKQEETFEFINSKKIDEFQFKSITEGLRSILDFLSEDINSLLKDKMEKPQFPAIKDAKSLSSNKFLKKVNIERPDISKIIEDIQPFKSDDKWLGNLADMTNDYKHNFLPTVNEEKAVKHGDFIKIVNSKDVTFESLQLGDKIYKNLEVDGDNVKYDNMDKIKSGFTIISDHLIQYQETTFNARDFLANCLNKIAQFINEYEKIK